MRAVDGQIKAPFAHRGIVDDVRCPHVAVDVEFLLVTGCGVSVGIRLGVEVGHVHFRALIVFGFRDLLDVECGANICGFSRSVTLMSQTDEIRIEPNAVVHNGPRLEVRAFAVAQMGSPDIVGFVGGAVDDAGIVDADGADCRGRIQRIDVRFGHLFSLCL